MPSLDFKGKNYIYSHHLSVPFRDLNIDESKSKPAKGDKPNMDDNLIIQGDNLHALKALLPRYAGKIKCIYIDPPYNTGNEGWCYNDKVNSPLMREWLKDNANPVDKDDLERHDKWLCMMWPRLQLLRELLADDGVIFISIDNNEIHNLKQICNEIFNEKNFIEQITWKRKTGSGTGISYVFSEHEYVLSYAKNIEGLPPWRILSDSDGNFKNPDNDPKGEWESCAITAPSKNRNKNQLYLIEFHFSNPKLVPNDIDDEGRKLINYFQYETYNEGKVSVVFREYDEQNGLTLEYFNEQENVAKFVRRWAYIPSTFKNIFREKRVFLNGRNLPRYKKYKEEYKGKALRSIYYDDFTTQQGTETLRAIMNKDTLEYPKSVKLVSHLVKAVTSHNDIILDSFAGSGTTAHATLGLNKEDGGNRKFILVEMEDYANDITAERVRRVIDGVPNAKDEDLKNGLGGSFTYCDLGEAFDVDKILTGEILPNYTALASYVFYTVTGQSLEKEAKQNVNFFVGETDLFEVYLIYKDDLAYLRHNDSALNQDKLDIIAAHNPKSTKQKIVFATAKYMSQDALKPHNIVFCQIPYAIHKIAGN